MECIFCQIVAGEVPSDTVYQDEEVMAFRDINPKASTHIIVIPKKHIPSLAHLNEEELPLMGHITGIINRLAREEGLSERGYKVVINCGKGGGQVIPHLHLHLLGGEYFFEPPL